jgi:hypothetical protein
MAGQVDAGGQKSDVRRTHHGCSSASIPLKVDAVVCAQFSATSAAGKAIRSLAQATGAKNGVLRTDAKTALKMASMRAMRAQISVHCLHFGRF